MVGVVGRVGAGKSSLLAAILSEMEQQGSGAVEVIGGPVAYVPQQSWIISGTIRENVLFGRPIDPARYAAVLTACQLDADLAAMAPTGGDETEIGERVKSPAICHESSVVSVLAAGRSSWGLFRGSTSPVGSGCGSRWPGRRTRRRTRPAAASWCCLTIRCRLSTRWSAGLSPGTQIQDTSSYKTTGAVC